MAYNNQDRNRSNQDRDRFNEENDYRQTQYGYNQNQNRNQDYGTSGYQRRMEEDPERVRYIPDNDENRQGYGREERTSYGSSGKYQTGGGFRNDPYYNEQRRTGGYGNAGYQGGYNQGYQSDAYSQRGLERQDWGRAKADTGYGDDRGFGTRDNISGNYQNREQFRNEDEPRNRYGGDTGNYGNANQGSFDRGWWDRTRDEVKSWFGKEDEDRGRRTENRITGTNRGKGPKNYQRSEERIREDVCDRLSDDDRIDATNIDVQIQNGEVILSGNVSSREEKRRAEDLVESISGVRNVENRIKVGGEDNTAGRTTGTDITGTERKR